jgi:hypothetical protein
VTGEEDKDGDKTVAWEEGGLEDNDAPEKEVNVREDNDEDDANVAGPPGRPEMNLHSRFIS